MRLTILTLVVAVMVLGLIFELLRRRRLREKYAVLWLAIAVVVFPLAAFPRIFDHIAGFVGVVSGVSLVLFLGLVMVLLICLHLSWEVSQLEEETRTLAEEIALLRMRQDAHETAAGRDPSAIGRDPAAIRRDSAAAGRDPGAANGLAPRGVPRQLPPPAADRPAANPSPGQGVLGADH